MNIIIRWYNQNRKQLFIVILIVASIIFTIHYINHLIKEDKKENLSYETGSSSTGSATTTYNPKQSIISSSNVSDKVYKEESKLIDEFMKYCNSGNTAEAYNLLSNDCKIVLFPTLEYFINNYQKVIFTEDRLYSIQNWKGNTYKISITENMLATGKSNKGITIEDYFSIVNENENKRLNINGFVGRKTINKSKTNENIEIKVKFEDTYMDYVIYTIETINKTDKILLLDSGESTQNMYIVDNNGVKHLSYRNEVVSAELKVLPYSKNELKVKYMSTNISTRNIKSMVFKDIVLDYNDYNNYQIKQEYKNRDSIAIDI